MLSYTLLPSNNFVYLLYLTILKAVLATKMQQNSNKGSTLLHSTVCVSSLQDNDSSSCETSAVYILQNPMLSFSLSLFLLFSLNFIVAKRHFRENRTDHGVPLCLSNQILVLLEFSDKNM
eukprot:m.123014 g.123014  ORF g.123014 m.123014 type:complete len:120 (+) comp14442_c0_seq1:1399-1758(+)